MLSILYHTLTIARLYINIYNEYMLKELFYECAYKGGWTTINDVDFKFIEKKDVLEIHFMGSKQTTDWIRNFLFTKKVYKEFRVHRGFYNAYSEVRDIILNKVYNSYSQDLKVVIVGYSHGSSLCTLCLEDLVYHFPQLKIKGYAFESPRCVKAPKKIRERWKNLTVIRCNNDIVTHCPPKFLGYNDLGTMLKIKGDTKLVDKWYLPKCIKSHYQQVVLDGLNKRTE